MMAETDKRFRCSERVHARRFDGEMVILDLGQGQYFSLDEVGSTIWEHASSGLSIGEIVKEIATVYDADVPRIQRDVERILEELVQAGLLVPRK